MRIDGEAGRCEWHPLFDHCADVGAVAEALLQLPVWRRRLVRLAGGDLGECGWARLGVLAALHDLGKLNIGFQAKGRPELGATAGHVEETLAALPHNVFSSLAELSSWGEGITPLLISAITTAGPTVSRPWVGNGRRVGGAHALAWIRLPAAARCSSAAERGTRTPSTSATPFPMFPRFRTRSPES